MGSFSGKLEAYYQKDKSDETVSASKDSTNSGTQIPGPVASMPRAPTVSPNTLEQDFEFIAPQGKGVESPPRVPSPTFSDLGKGYDYSLPKTTKAKKDKGKQVTTSNKGGNDGNTDDLKTFNALSAPQNRNKKVTTAGPDCSRCGKKIKGPASPGWVLCDICAVALGAVNGDGRALMRQ